MNSIESFTGDYGFLSNFYPSKIVLAGMVYPTVENAYQACKTKNKDDHEKIAMMTAGQAKRYGQKVTLVPGWEENKVLVMSFLLDKKFFTPAMKTLLLATGDATLIEGNDWHDNYWGACSCDKCADKRKLNVLGNLLMKVRKQIS